MSGGITTTGGAGGVTAKYADMLAAADALEATAAAVISRAGDIEAVALNIDLIESAVLSPRTAAAVAEHIVRSTAGPHGLLPTAVRLEATALMLRTSVTAYRTLDEAQAAAISVGQDVAAPAAIVGIFGFESLRALGDLKAGNLTGLRNIPGVALNDTMSTLYANPWIVDGVLEDSPALMWGLGALAGPGGTALIGAWTQRTEGSPFPPLNLEQASGDMVALGGLFGMFRAGTPSTIVHGPQDAVGHSLGIVPPEEAITPTSLATTMEGINGLGKEPGTVRLFRVAKPGEPVRWVVEIPGTQAWSPTSGSNPVDLTNNLRLMAGQQTEQNEAIRQAMRRAGVGPGEPVMLAGHSQGGITAASLAADPATRQEFDITNVYTGGAPISGFHIPDNVQVLSIEHTRDAVPRLDGQPNPDRPNWLTVHHDADGDLRSGRKPPVSDTGATHDSYVYSTTAAQVDTSDLPGVIAMRRNFDPFMTTDNSQITQHTIELTRNLP